MAEWLKDFNYNKFFGIRNNMKTVHPQTQSLVFREARILPLSQLFW